MFFLLRAIALILFALPALSSFPLQEATSEEEALSLRRIADFWEEEELSLACQEIETFLSSFPDSHNRPFLHAILGDLLLKEKEYEKALEYYDLAACPTDPNRLFCLLALQKTAPLIEVCRRELKEETCPPDKASELSTLLALALAQECNAQNRPLEEIRLLAEEALPLFNSILTTAWRDDLAFAFASVCAALQDFEKASEIYSSLAEKQEGNLKEECLFQAALFQAKTAPEKALSLFEEIAHRESPLAKEASFNCLALSFSAGKYRQLLEEKDRFLKEVPEEKESAAHLLLARASLAEGDLMQTIGELQACLKKDGATPEVVHWLIETGCLAQDPSLFEKELSSLNSDDPVRLRGELLALKLSSEPNEEKLVRLGEKMKGLLASPYKEEALSFELELLFGLEDWSQCLEKSSSLKTPIGWKYRILSLAKQPDLDPSSLLSAIEEALSLDFFSPDEKEELLLLQAKALYEQKHYEAALERLSSLPESGDCDLLRALCLREAKSASFIPHLEKALSQGTTLWGKGALHLALFNAYLEDPSQNEKAAHHLLLAFEEGISLQKENALWLVDYFFPNPKIRPLLESLQEEEIAKIKLAELAFLEGNLEEALQKIQGVEGSEAKLLQGKILAALGSFEKAVACFDFVLEKGEKREEKSAALLEKALLQKQQLNQEDRGTALWSSVAKDLKTLVLQKYLPNEPTHLEAALAYSDLYLSAPLEKRFSLWKKLKGEFSEKKSIVGQDYQYARSLFPEKEALLLSYLSYIEAEILLIRSNLELQKELQTNGKELLLQIMKESPSPSLRKRAEERLHEIDESSA